MTEKSQNKFQIKFKSAMANVAYALAPDVKEKVQSLTQENKKLWGANRKLGMYKSAYIDLFVYAVCDALDNEELSNSEICENLERAMFDSSLYEEICNQIQSGKMQITEYRNEVVAFKNGIAINLRNGKLLCAGMEISFLEDVYLYRVKKLIMERMYANYMDLSKMQNIAPNEKQK